MIRIRVLQFGMSSASEAGGIETYLITQYRSLVNSAIHYDFISPQTAEPMAFEDEVVRGGSRVLHVRDRRKYPLGYYLDLVSLFFKVRGRYDAIVVNASALTFASIVLLSYFAGIPCRVYHSHCSGNGHVHGLLYRAVAQIDRILLRLFATHLFACSDVAGDWMFGPKANYLIVKNAIEIEPWLFDAELRNGVRRELGVESRFVVGMIGSFYVPKNHLFGIKVLSSILKLHPQTTLLLCGGRKKGVDDTYQQVVEYIAQEGLGDSVRMLGFRSDIARILQAVDAVIMPSFSEGLPLVGVEAQIAGVPCYFSEAITRDVTIGKYATFLPIKGNEDPDRWAAAILAHRDVERKSPSLQEIEDRGFSCVKEAEKLEKFFQKMSRH